MKDLCRFDYVVDAVEGLQKYMKTCRVSDDTQGIIKGIQSSLDKLLKIEETIAGGGHVYSHEVKPVFEELEEKQQKLEEHFIPLYRLLKDHEYKFKELGKLFKKIENVNSYAKRVILLHNGIVNLRLEIRQRVKETNRKVRKIG